MRLRAFRVSTAPRSRFAPISGLTASWACRARLRGRLCRGGLAMLLPAALVVLAPAVLARTAHATT